MFGLIKELWSKARNPEPVVFGNQAFVLASLPMRGQDSVLRLSPASQGTFASDIAGGGMISGYAAAQGAPMRLPHMGGSVDLSGAGAPSGYSRQPGALLDLGRAMASQKVVQS